jgi:hypothetical protein
MGEFEKKDECKVRLCKLKMVGCFGTLAKSRKASRNGRSSWWIWVTIVFRELED